MKKILYIMRPDIKDLPPVMSQIQLLSENGYDVSLVTYFLSDESIKWLEGIKVNFYFYGKNDILTKNKLKKYYRYFAFKRYLRKFIHNKEFDYLWVGSRETLLALGKAVLKYTYIVNIYELPEFKGLKDALTYKYIKNANSIIVPEYNRAHIIQSKWNLEQTPFVITNKPLYKADTDFVYKNDEFDKYISNGYKVVLYQGILSEERDLKPLARSLSQMDEKYLLLIMASDKFSTEIDKIKTIYKDTIHIGFITPPKHLSITKMAYIGITTYDHSSLNTVFCAPNKIYEYAMMGLPMLCNDIPGLRYTVGRTDTGVCVDMKDEKRIIEGINKINNNYISYKQNLSKLLETDDEKNFDEVLRRLEGK